jgi:thiol:disulfide interchange protein
MKNISMLTFSLLSILVIASCGYSTMGGGGANRQDRTSSPSKIFFESSKYEKVLAMAEAEQKPVFLDFYTDWCAPCRWLDRDVFATENAAKYFNKNVINLKVNAEKGEGIELAQKFNIQSYPNLIFLKPNGTEISRHVGMTTSNRLVGMGRKSVKVITQENEEKNKK